MEWMRNSVTRTGLGAFMALSLTLSACGDSTTDDATGETTATRIAACKDLVGDQKYSEALKKANAALESDADNSDAHYCATLAHVGVIVNTVSAIISAAANLNLAPEYRAAIDGKQFLLPFVEDIESGIAGIDKHAYALVGMDNPTFQIDSFPLSLNTADLVKLVGKFSDADIQVQGEAEIDLNGVWDLSQIQALAGAGNAIQGVLDYLFAHDLNLDEINDLELKTTEGIAAALHANNRLLKLATDADSTARLSGDDRYKGVRLDALSALSYLVGRASALERVAPASEGLVAAIKANAGKTDRVVVWTDADADGIPEKIKVPAIDVVNENLTITIDGVVETIPSEFDNPLSATFWTSLIDLGAEIRDNVEDNGASQIAVKTLVDAAIAEFNDNADVNEFIVDLWPSAVTYAAMEFPDLVYVSPGEFLAEPKGVRSMIPYYFSHTTDGTTYAWDMAIEFEGYLNGTTITNEKIGKKFESAADADFAHFDYGANVDGVLEYLFDDFDTEPAKIAADTLRPTLELTELIYVALQDPAFGGLLYTKTDALADYPLTKSATPAKPDSAGFNAGLNALLLYYNPAP